MLWKQNKTQLVRNILKLVLLFFLLQSAFGTLHKHAEVNLHFHAENIITQDHTISQENDCSICPALATNFFIIYKSSQIYINKVTSLGAISNNPLFLFSELSGIKLGRSPPLS